MIKDYEDELDRVEKELDNIIKRRLETYRKTIGYLLEQLNSLEKEYKLLAKENERLRETLTIVSMENLKK